jgi:hypothetical protein
LRPSLAPDAQASTKGWVGDRSVARRRLSRTTSARLAHPHRARSRSSSPTSLSRSMNCTRREPLPLGYPMEPQPRGLIVCRVTVSYYQSSPRKWGNARVRHAASSTRRFTPTHVGNTVGPTGRHVANLGPPPLAWGIPQGSPIPDPAPSVHPHASGEYHVFLNGGAVRLGSTPPVWGTCCYLTHPWNHRQGTKKQAGRSRPSRLQVPTCTGTLAHTAQSHGRMPCLSVISLI